MTKIVSLRPRLSEKSVAASEKGVHVFDVPGNANKQVVKEAVQDQYKVTVTEVRTATIKGKVKRSARKRQRPVSGQRSDVKKAYVTLKKGDRITVFPEAE